MTDFCSMHTATLLKALYLIDFSNGLMIVALPADRCGWIMKDEDALP